jgi:hypothetical protein
MSKGFGKRPWVRNKGCLRLENASRSLAVAVNAMNLKRLPTARSRKGSGDQRRRCVVRGLFIA